MKPLAGGRHPFPAARARPRFRRSSRPPPSPQKIAASGAPRRRSHRDRARDQAEHRRTADRRGWIDDHATGREAAAEPAGAAAAARLAGEGARSRPRAAARAPPAEARDSRALSEPRRLRQPDRRLRAREPTLLRCRVADADRRAGGVPRRPAAAADDVQSVPQPGAAMSRQRVRAGADEGGRAPHGRAGRRGARRAAGCSLASTGPSSRRTSSRWCCAGAGPQRPSRIETTLDARLQEDIAGILRTQRASLDRHGAANVAVVVLDNERGEWLAWEGSGDYFDAEHGGAINGPLMPRQPGSALKPLTYALAFEKGFTPASVLPDVPMHFPTARARRRLQPAQLRRPLPRAAAGARRARRIRERSCGRARVRAGRSGSAALPATAPGSRPSTRPPLTTASGLTLGNAEVRLDELVTAYAALARGGEWRRSTYLTRRERGTAHAGLAAHRILARRHPRRTPRRAPTSSAAAAASSCRSRWRSRPGTSQAYHDNWTIGFTRRVTVGVWVGNFDRRPLRNSSGVTGAAPIFQAVMLAAHRAAGADRRSSARSRPVAGRAARSARSPASSPTPGARCADANGCPNRANRCRAAGITSQTRARSSSGPRRSASGRAATIRRSA